MGIVLTNELEGLAKGYPLLEASTLCGACNEVCPVKVPLVKLIRLLRERAVREGYTTAAERAGMSAFGLAVGSPSLFAVGQKASRFAWPLLSLVSGSGAFSRMPVPARESFKKRVPVGTVSRT